MLRRLVNGVRKVAAGLRPFGESVWPGVPNDLFVAHRSIYAFFARHCAGHVVLDAGCGTGYGSFDLARSGARSVLGIDVDPLSVRYARRHFAAPNLRFEVRDCEALPHTGPPFEVVVTSNMLEHLRDPLAFLAAVRARLTAEGILIVAVPPILGTEDLRVHEHIHYHRSNHPVDGWLGIFAGDGWHAELFRHDYTGPGHLDFGARVPSSADARDFTFAPTSREDLYAHAPITALFVLTRERGMGRAAT